MKIPRPFSFALVLLSALLAPPTTIVVAAQAPAKAIILSWDGAVSSFIHDLINQGKMPHLTKLIANGAFADSVIPVFPSKTAPGFAALWTATPPRVNGINGNYIPRLPPGEFSILQNTSGLFSTSLSAEPLWFSAARSGRSVVIVQATQGWPFVSYVANGRFGQGLANRLTIFEGYAGVAGHDRVVTARSAPARRAKGWKNVPQSAIPPLEFNFRIGSTRFFGLLIDDPEDPTRGFDTIVVTRAKDGLRTEARLKPGPSSPRRTDKWSGTIEVKTEKQPEAWTRLRLFELNRDGSAFLLYFSRPARRFATRPELLAPLRAAAGPFIGNGANRLYRQGALGPTLPQGGDGTAEQRYLETVRLSQEEVLAATRWVLEHVPADLFFAYTTYPDEAEHLWRGYLDPGLPGFKQAIADRLRPFLEEVYRICDELLGRVMAAWPEDSIIALLSDHGMEGVNKTIAINAALRQAGLLALTANGRVDLAKTKALYPVFNNGYILINDKKRKEGLVGPEERTQVVAQVRMALQRIRDGKRPVITRIIDAQSHGENMGIGGVGAGDLYLDLLPGYDFDGRYDASDLIAPREPYGMHGFNPLRPSMRTIMVLNGPGVHPGRRLSNVRLIDFAPTLSKLLKIPPPRSAAGRVLEEALSPP